MKKLVLALLLISNLACAGLDVEVEGQGSSVDSAKKDAFRKAIEQAVGTVVISDQEVQKDQLTKDFIGSYSSGFIEDYAVEDSYQDLDGLWTVHMKVRVATSKIAERMRSRAQHSSNIDGQKIADSVTSQLNMLESGDAMLTNVLSNYPQNAYVINSGETTFKVGRLRQPYVDVPYDLSMSKSWVEAFGEAVKHVAVDGKDCSTLAMSVAQSMEDAPRNSATVKDLASRVCGKDPDIRVFYRRSGDYFPRSYSYYLPDQITLDTINQQFQQSVGVQHVGLKVDLLDANGGVIDSRCAKIENQMFIFYSEPVGTYNLRDMKRLSRPNVMGQNKVHGTLRIQLHNTYQIQNLSRIQLSVEKTCI